VLRGGHARRRTGRGATAPGGEVRRLPELGAGQGVAGRRSQWPGMAQAAVLRSIRLLGEQVLPALSAS
jgi:hypothetical protein